MTSLARLLVGATLAVALSACGDPPPPPPAPPPQPVPEPEPPPRPACQTLEEGCETDAGTRLPVPGTNLSFDPPDGWVYAKRDDASVVQKADDGALLVVASFESLEDTEAAADRRAELVASFSERYELAPATPIEVKVPPKHRERAIDTFARGSLGAGEGSTWEMMQWELGGSGRRGVEGAILVFTAPVDGRDVFGLAYAPAADAEGTSAIIETQKTFASAGDEPAGGANTKEGGEDDGT